MMFRIPTRQRMRDYSYVANRAATRPAHKAPVAPQTHKTGEEK